MATLTSEAEGLLGGECPLVVERMEGDGGIGSSPLEYVALVIEQDGQGEVQLRDGFQVL